MPHTVYVHAPDPDQPTATPEPLEVDWGLIADAIHEQANQLLTDTQWLLALGGLLGLMIAWVMLKRFLRSIDAEFKAYDRAANRSHGTYASNRYLR